MKRLGIGFPCPSCIALAGALALGPLLTPFPLRAQEAPTVDPNKMSDLGTKTFDTRMIDFDKQSGLAKTAPGFDKEFKTNGNASDLIHKTANLGGRQIYEPMLDFNKTYPTSDSTLFKAASPFSDKVSSLTANKQSPFSTGTKAPGFDKMMPDKVYQGPESSLIREAMDRLDQTSAQELAQRMNAQNNPTAAASKPDSLGGPQQLAVAPMISIDDVRLLINKDVAPASEASTQAAAPDPTVAPAPAAIATPAPAKAP